MKKVAVSLIFTIITTSGLYAQWSTSGANIYNSNAGNVGIGTTTPITTLSVNGGITSGRLGYYGTYSSTQIQGIWSIEPSYHVDLGNNNFGTQYGIGYAFSTFGGAPFPNEHQIVFTNNGTINGTISLSGNLKFSGTGYFGRKVVIGSPTITDSYDQLYSAGDNPGIRLEVQRDYGGAAFDFANLYAHKTTATGDALWGKLGIYGSFGTSGVAAAPVVTYMYFGTETNVSYSNNTFRLYPNKTAYFDGNLGIGITAPQAKLDVNGNIYSNGKIFIGTPDANTLTKIAPYSLAVNGSAIFTKAVVKPNSAWPDYVFTPSYKIPKLDSLEQFIKANRRLPEIPTAKNVEKNGIDLGNNQALLLKKIEELTLIVIEQNKRLEKVEKKLELKSRNH